MNQAEHSQVGSYSYYASVLKNGARLKQAEQAAYQFGTTGKQAVQPNYKITYHTGDHRIFNGNGHGLFSGHTDFEESNLTRPYTHAEVLAFQHAATAKA